MNDLTVIQTQESLEAEFNRTWRMAEIMSQGKATMPKHLQGNQADCFAIAEQAAAWGMRPFAVAQKTHLINGVLGYEAQLVNAVISSSKAITGRFKYDFFGNWDNVIGNVVQKKSATGSLYMVPNWNFNDEKGCGVTVSAILHGETERTGLDILLSQAQVRNSTLWGSDPKQQLCYLAVKRWSRLYTPDVILGVYSADELQDPIHERDITPDTKDFVNTVELVNVETGEVVEKENGAQMKIDSAILKIQQCLTTKDVQTLELELKHELADLDDKQRSPIRV
jgi:hypothetical protein